MTTSVYGGILSRTGRRGGGGEATQRQPVATRRRPKIPAKHSRACALVPEPPGAAQYTGQLRISRGKQPLCEATLPGLSPRGRTIRRLPVYWGLADSQREQLQLEMWRRSQGNTRQHMEVLSLIVVSTVSSPMGPAAADPLDFAESQKGLQLPRAQRQRASHQNLGVANHPFSRGGRVGAKNGASPSTPWPNLWMSRGRSVRF